MPDIPLDTPTMIPIESLPAETSTQTQAPVTTESKGEMLSMDEMTSPNETSTPITNRTTKQNEKPKIDQQFATDDKELESERDPDEAGEDAEEPKTKSVKEKDDVTLTKEEQEELKLHGNNKRDFTGFTDDEKRILKRLDNPRFLKISNAWKNLKQEAGKVAEYQQKVTALETKLKEGGVPDSWIEHPLAFTLSPKFNEVSNKLSRIEYEEQFYQQQHLKVKAGETFQRIDGWNNGQPVLSQPIEATTQADLWLSGLQSRAINMKGSLEQQLQGMQSQFAQQHTSAVNDFKLNTDNLINKLPTELKPIEADEKIMEAAIPEFLRNNPLLYSLKKLYGVNQQLARENQKLKSGTALTNKLANDRKLAPANPNKFPRDPSGGGVNGNGKVSTRNGRKINGDFNRDDFSDPE